MIPKEWKQLVLLLFWSSSICETTARQEYEICGLAVTVDTSNSANKFHHWIRSRVVSHIRLTITNSVISKLSILNNRLPRHTPNQRSKKVLADSSFQHLRQTKFSAYTILSMRGTQILRLSNRVVRWSRETSRTLDSAKKHYYLQNQLKYSCSCHLNLSNGACIALSGKLYRRLTLFSSNPCMYIYNIGRTE